MPTFNILFLLTSHDDLGGVRKTGFHVNETAGLWDKFAAAGHSVRLTSIAGGVPPQDRRRDSDLAQRFLSDAEIARQLMNTPALADIDPNNYDAVVFVGGHGAMWDFPGNEDITRIGRAIYESGGVVSAICHGPAALVELRLSDGVHLIRGKQVAGFTNAEEESVGLADVVPFLLADALEAAGATHVPGSDFEEQVVVDGRLVTGQNPNSAAAVATGVLETLLTRTATPTHQAPQQPA